MQEIEQKIAGAPEGIKATVKHNRILLEILVHGTQEDKKKMEKMNTDLQNQMYTKKNIARARILWIVNGEKTAEERKEWLIENCNAKYYVFAPETYHVKKDFVDKALLNIKRFETAFNTLKAAGVTISKNKPKPEEVVPYAEIVSDEPVMKVEKNEDSGSVSDNNA